MRIKNSIFFKYFSITATVLLCSFIIYSAILIAYSRTQWINEKNEILGRNVHAIAQQTEQSLQSFSFNEQSRNLLTLSSNIVGAEIFIVDSEGENITCSHPANENCTHKLNTVPYTAMEKIKGGEDVYTFGTLDNMYQTRHYTVGTPIYYNDTIAGAVFASVPSANLSLYIGELVKIILICAMIVMISAFVVIYIVTAQLTRPIRLMAQAARKLEQGEMIQNIPIESRDEIGLLSEEFNRMSKSLASLENMRRSFISSVSHELKTPMTTISGFIDGILDGTIPQSDQGKYLKIVSDETKRLSRLVNSMLQLSKFESEQMKLNVTSFNMTDMLLQILFSFENRIENKNIDIRGLDDIDTVFLSADSDLIYQVMYNLIENAVKFTPENGYIEFKINLQKDKMHLYIKNSGDGMTEQELGRIFERFYKSDRSRSEDKTGMGFGLYIVKLILKLHGGNIIASSVLGEYTCFEVNLPNAQLKTR